MEKFQKLGAVLLGGVYVTGVAVTSIHLNRFGIYDLALAKILYISSGSICLGFVALQITTAWALVNFRFVIRHLESTHGAVQASLSELGLFRQIDKIVNRKCLRPFLGGYSTEGISLRVFNIILFLVGGILILAAAALFDFESSGLRFSVGSRVAGVTWLFLFLILAYAAWLWISPPFRSQRGLRILWRLVFAVLIFWNVAFYALTLHPILRPAFGGGAAYRVVLEPTNKVAEQRILQLVDRDSADLDAGAFYLVHESANAYYLTDKYERAYGSSDVTEILQYGRMFRIDKTAVIGYEIVDVR